MPSLEGDLDHYPRKFGKYHLLGPLAQGGMGALYLAVTGDRGLERLMVIKTVLPHLADAEYVARFRDEAKVVVKLSHGNLIPVFDAGVVGGEMFLAMDFVEGRDLRAVWNRCAKKQVAFPIDIAVYIIKELCRGLSYAHTYPELNLVHRDISPPNVLVSYTGEVKLTDFGLASSTLKLEKTAPGIIYGKVAYMSPEQARGEKLDGRSDMYASAIVLWELLTGRQLFPPGKDQPQDLLARAKNPEPMRPSKRAPRVPVELDEICLRALAAERKDRYANCDEMRMALQQWLSTNAPTTDGTRMSTFLQELFSEDIVRERGERTELISRVRTRALTLPPTDELRRWIEKSGGLPRGPNDTDVDDAAMIHSEVPGQGNEPPVRKPGSVGRRAGDRGIDGEDRRGNVSGDRRAERARSPVVGTERNAGAAALAQQHDPEAEPDLTGIIVDGRYRVIELIGEGGMGKVYLAEHVEIGKRVALKVLHPSYSRMPDLVERFRREARAASKIGHPNIVDVTDSGTTAEGSVYFVMEYLEGVELGSVIEREGALDVARALKIAGQICRALAAAHAQGIVHRDLKPENIYLITRDGAADVVKVLDFGIAKTTEAEAARERRLTSPGMAMGTPEYMSPEQAAGRAADARCDVYALGAIMYEMSTGIPPYSGDNFMEILTKKATQDPPPPTIVRRDLPAQVSDLVMAAMARNPDDRPQTMEKLEYELNKCLSGRGIAVAQILGMTTDANVVERLNPGLSMRITEEGIVSSRPSTQVQSLRAGTHSGVATLPGDLSPMSASWSGPTMATGQSSMPAMQRMASEPVPASAASSLDSLRVPPSAPVRAITASGDIQIPQKRSALSILGWLLLATLLFGGVGALLYVALGERTQRGSSVGKLEATQPPREDGSATPETPALKPDNGSAAIESNPPVGSGSDNLGPGLKLEPDKAGSNATIAKQPPVQRPKPPSRIAVNEKDPQALLRQGATFERTNNWENARQLYEKLEGIKGYAGIAQFQQAWVAFRTNDNQRAEDLSKKAIANTQGAWQFRAKTLYGDAMFGKGLYQRAKDVYLNLRNSTPNAKLMADLASKIKNCNKGLKVPNVNDGL